MRKKRLDGGPVSAAARPSAQGALPWPVHASISAVAEWVDARLAARVFVGLIGVVCIFQLTLALGAPWARFAMGGAYPDAYPPEMRLVALGQVVLLATTARVVLNRARFAGGSGRRLARGSTWAIAGLFLVGFGLNLISPSEGERLLWAPVALVLSLTAARVAASR